jgi:hypothetical protein
VKTLSAAGVEVYIDAGNPGFVTDTSILRLCTYWT